MRETFESVFDARTVRLLLLGGLALGVAFLASSRQLFAHIGLAGVAVNGVVQQTFAYGGAVLLLMTITSGLLTLRPSRREAIAKGVEPGAPAVLGGQLILGIDVARSQISYGALSIKYVESRPQDASPLARIRLEELVPTRTRPLHQDGAKQQIYEELVSVVLELVDAVEAKFEQQVTISGIAITTPSWIDIKTKTLASPIGPLPVNEGVADGLARYLWERQPARVQKAFGTSEAPIVSEQDLLDKIFLDVDSRSAARYDLQRRLSSGHNRNNYACVIILEGVGAGIVLDDEIYHGTHGSEGEVGHTTVHLDPEWNIPDAAGPGIRIDRCDCQLPGIHWESVGSITGIRLLAESFDPERFGRLAAAYGRRPESADLIDVAWLARGGNASASMPDTARDLVSRDAGYRVYTDRVFKEYARIITLGIANLVNVLDLEHVVIGGPLIKGLDRLEFRNEIWDCWNHYVLRGRSVTYSFESLKQLWQGAALLFWDPGYRRRLL